MKTNFLFPPQFRTLGWLLFVPALIVAIAMVSMNLEVDQMLQSKVFAIVDNEFLSKNTYFTFTENSIGDEILITCLILGGIFIGFSRLRNEDEYIAQIRYESLVWATYFNFFIILLATIFVYGFAYYNVLLANLFTLLLFFVIRFNVMLYRMNKSEKDDE